MMPPTDTYWRAWLTRRGPHVRDRILGFHPTPPDPGRTIRGWNPSRNFTKPPPFSHFIGRMAVIRRYGRSAWDVLRRRGILLKCGRRHYVPALALAMLRLEQEGPARDELEAFLTPTPTPRPLTGRVLEAAE